MGLLLIMEKKWVFPLIISSVIFVFFLAISLDMGLASSLHTINSIFSILPSRNHTEPVFIETKIANQSPPPPGSAIPRFAYLISGSKGDLEKLWRTLKALYHPLNQYVVHLDLESPADERLELAARIAKTPMFAKVGNVHVIKKANMVTYRGPTMVANTLHACAILLKESKEWDWFINLSASDYPLVTQDDLIYTFSSLKRDLNFIDHTSQLGWKENKRAMPIMIDPGLYQSMKSDIFWVSPRRTLPTAFKLFTGSAWMILSRPFIEYCIWGWDNLPRTLLMYYANFVSSPEGYFHTVVCNSPAFAATVVNHDMHHIQWDTPPRQHPHVLSIADFGPMVASGAAFARKFKGNDSVLDKIDRELLGRRDDGLGFVRGGWCEGGKKGCSEVGEAERVEPGSGAERLGGLVKRLLEKKNFGRNQCR